MIGPEGHYPYRDAVNAGDPGLVGADIFPDPDDLDWKRDESELEATKSIIGEIDG